VAGLGVHIASRIEALAKPGEVLVSQTVRDLVVGSGIEFEDRGAHPLKGVPGRWHLLSVRSWGSPEQSLRSSSIFRLWTLGWRDDWLSPDRRHLLVIIRGWPSCSARTSCDGNGGSGSLESQRPTPKLLPSALAPYVKPVMSVWQFPATPGVVWLVLPAPASDQRALCFGLRRLQNRTL